MERFEVQDGSGKWRAARAACHIRGTNIGAACGLDDSHSRAQFWRLLKGIEKEEDRDSRPFMVQEMLNKGKEDEPLAAFAVPLPPDNFLCHSGQWRANYRGVRLGANLDRVEWTCRPKLEPVGLVEIKTCQNEQEGVDEWTRQLLPNCLQLLLQLYCTRLTYGKLFYWRRSTGEWRLFRLRLDPEAFQLGPLDWAVDVVKSELEPKRMDSDTKRERTQYVLEHFFY